MWLLAPENRRCYARQVRAGFGFYLDCYINPPGSPWYIGAAPGSTRLQKLADNVESALDVSDEYVWIYGQKRRWWDTGGPGVSWEDALPGISGVLTGARATANGETGER
jgi:hypothetical protein